MRISHLIRWQIGTAQESKDVEGRDRWVGRDAVTSRARAGPGTAADVRGLSRSSGSGSTLCGRGAWPDRGGFTCRAVVVLLHRLPSAVLSRDPRMRTSLVLSLTHHPRHYFVMNVMPTADVSTTVPRFTYTIAVLLSLIAAVTTSAGSRYR